MLLQAVSHFNQNLPLTSLRLRNSSRRGLVLEPLPLKWLQGMALQSLTMQSRRS